MKACFPKISCTLFLLIHIYSNLLAQDVDKNNMVGFGCYFAGQPSKAVVSVTRIVQEQRYHDLSKLLKNGKEAEKYLAVVALEKLDAVERYELSDDEKQLIGKIKTSHEKVSVCSGCTHWDKVSLKEMFSKNNFLGSAWWIEELLGIKKTPTP